MDTFSTTYRNLAKAIEEYPNDAPRKPLGADSVPVKSIRIAPTLFAARSSGRSNDPGGYNEQARELHRAFKALPEGERYFDPITVYEVAGQDYCIDGHHRLAVYRTAKVTGKVPVRRIGGTLEEAVRAGIEINAKTQLPMTLQERQEAAWKLVRLGHGTKAQQARWSGTSERTVARLRELKRQLEEHFPGDDWGCLWEARKLLEDQEDAPEWGEEQEAAEIEEYKKRLLKALGPKLHTRLDIIAKAIAALTSGQLLVDAVENIGDDYGPILWDVEDEIEDDF